MRKLLLMVCALFGFMACTQNPIEEQLDIRTDAPETLRVGFEDDETRIQLNSTQKTVWTKGDLVSVFYRSDANQKWQYQGETGERVGDLKRVDAGTATESTKRVVVVYPYNENYYINTETYNVQATLPATQHYLANSYGTDGNIMISSSEYNQFSLKSVCGWLKLQLTGNGEVVKSIKFRGNNDEQVAGELYINSTDATAMLASDMGGTDDNNAGGNLVFDDTILTEVTLDCGAGVTLGKGATAFYIALPPQTFANGFTVEIEDTDGYVMEQSTAKTFVVERNTISPMAALEFVNPNRPTQPTPANNEIWYTNGSTTQATTPYRTNVFGANIVSNTYDAEKECWVITFDGDVTTIGDYAFRDCSSLTSVIIPDSVTTIESHAFVDCSSLTCVTIPDSVTTIGDDAFGSCSSLTSVTIPDSVTTIGYSVFAGCRSLTSVTIPDSVTTIGDMAFAYCSSLTNVTIPDSVTTIGDMAFAYCSSLTKFNGKFASEDSRCLIIDGTLNSFAPAGLTEYTILNSVTTIGEVAFSGCSSLTSVTIPDSVTTIGNTAFYGCSSLTSVTIPDSVTTIGYYAFSDCSSLKKVYCKAVTPPAGGYNMFYNNASGRKIYVPTGSVEAYKSASYWSSYADAIVGYDFENGVAVTPKPANNEIWYTNGSTTKATTPNKTNAFGANIVSNTYDAAKECWVIKFNGKVTTIGDEAFTFCSSLTSVTIPDSVTTIGDYAFYDCSRLTIVTIPDSVTAIGYEAFYNCHSLTSVTIPDSVTTIGEGVFAECYSLRSVTIGDSVTTIGVDAFSGCDILTSVTIPDSVTTIGEGAFYYCGSLASVTIPDSVTTIGDSAFYYCSLTSVTIPDSVTTIGNYAFAYCDSLTSVTIGDSVTTIGNSAFSWCESLTSVTIPDSVNTIGKSAFVGCSSLTSVTIGDSVTTIGEFTFGWCESLTSVTIGDSVTTIGEGAFSCCYSLTSVTIPDSVTTIGYSAFSVCESLTSVTIPDSVTTIRYAAFYACSSLTSVTIPDSVTTIGSSAFYGCSSLTSVTIPDSVTTIGKSAFEDCSGLTSVYCKAITPPAGDDYMFYNNASGRKIYVPTESVEAYKSASYWSEYASSIEGYNF